MPNDRLKPVIIIFLSLALVAVIVWLATSSLRRQTPAVPQAEVQDRERFWIDLNMQPALAAWFNQVAQPGDMARADQLSQISWLDEVTVGRNVVVFKSATIAEQIVPRIADRIDVLGYNLEHGPLNPLDEQADPVGSIQRMRALADRYGMELALGPDHDFALSHGVALAPYVDIFVMQVQRVQTQPEVVREFVVPLAEQVRQANDQIKTSIQVRTEGDVEALVELIESLRESLDGISILTSPDTTEMAKALMTALRPSLPEVQTTAIEQAVPQQQSETTPSWFLILSLLAFGVGAGVIGVVLGIFAMMVWRKSKTQ